MICVALSSVYHLSLGILLKPVGVKLYEVLFNSRSLIVCQNLPFADESPLNSAKVGN